ncbi:hypothetical protein MEO41_27105, partial [Dolichospermum sp. ST_sed4]|nr:hypothetical protein [Dolichospermum sp. ST_sed4]
GCDESRTPGSNREERGIIPAFDSTSAEETFAKIAHWVAPCPVANATGLPAIALPVGFDSNGLPLSVQLIGKPAAESTLISLAAQLEAANPWIQHRPKF